MRIGLEVVMAMTIIGLVFWRPEKDCTARIRKTPVPNCTFGFRYFILAKEMEIEMERGRKRSPMCENERQVRDHETAS